MNDNDIIKAIEHCLSRAECYDCPGNPHIGNYGYCTDNLLRNALDLINRQKAEIERLKAENKTAQTERDQWYAEYHSVKFDLKQSKMYENSAHKLAEDYIAKFRTARAEAIKEFAERLKNKSDYCYLGNIDSLAYRILEKDLNALVKGMTEEAE